MNDEKHQWIYKTKEYSRFKFASFNRDVNKSNLKKLIKAGQTDPKFNLFPIVIDRNNFIIDGQHRFKACQELSLPVYYIYDERDSATPELVYSLNTTGKKHTNEERIIMLAKSGNEAAQCMVDLCKRFKKFRLISIAELCYRTSSVGVKIDKILDQEMPKKENLKIIGDLNKLQMPKLSNRLCRAYSRALYVSGIQSKQFIKRIIRNERLVFDGGREADVFNSLIKAYNFGLREKNKIKTSI